MKKFYIILLAVIFTFQFSACSAQTYETREIQATVIKCEKGIFLPHEEYLAQANICLAFEKLAAYEYYKELANEHGSYQYNVTVEFDGNEYTVSRMEEFEIGTSIAISATFTYSDDEVVYIKCE